MVDKMSKPTKPSKPTPVAVDTHAAAIPLSIAGEINN
jgi:hypothetical protein